MRVFASAERPAWPASRPDNQKNASRYGSLPRRTTQMAEFGNYVIYLIMLGAVLGALASILRPESGLGREFVNGIHAIGPVFLAQAGIMVAIPYLSKAISHALGPFFQTLGSDVSIAALSIIAVDMGGLPVGRCPDRQPRHVDYCHAGGLHLRRDHRLPDPGRPDHARAQGPQVPGAGGDGRVDQHSVRGAGGVAADYPQPHPGARTGIDRFAGPALPVAGLPRHASAAGAAVRLLLPAGRRPGSTGRRRWSPGSWYSAR